MNHLLYVVRCALRHPLIALGGAREFRCFFTKHYDDDDLLQSYDSGRELAHMLTLRWYDDRGWGR